MNHNLNKIKELIVTSELSAEDKKDLAALFSRSDDERLKVVAGLFKEYPEYISIINNNYKIKQEAFQKQDKALWHDIFRKEYRSLKIIQ